MTLDCGASFVYDVNVINACDFLRYSYSCTITMMKQWKDLKAATAFQILCVYFKQISVEKKNNYSFTASCLKI